MTRRVAAAVFALLVLGVAGAGCGHYGPPERGTMDGQTAVSETRPAAEDEERCDEP